MYDRDEVIEVKKDLLRAMILLLEQSPSAFSDVAQTWEFAKFLHEDAAEVALERSHLALVKS